MDNILGQYQPSAEEVEKYLHQWECMDNYVAQENALDKLFFELCPKNEDMNDILLKCATLNDFYSTNIFDVYSVARHILAVPNIDDRLKKGDKSLVKEIARLTVGKDQSPRFFYSFASKYCSHHQPLLYAIYDNYVHKVLMALKKRDAFAVFKNNDLKEYDIFIDIIKKFQRFYKLDNYNLKQIDKYLWQLGREWYGKKKF